MGRNQSIATIFQTYKSSLRYVVPMLCTGLQDGFHLTVEPLSRISTIKRIQVSKDHLLQSEGWSLQQFQPAQYAHQHHLQNLMASVADRGVATRITRVLTSTHTHVMFTPVDIYEQCTTHVKYNRQVQRITQVYKGRGNIGWTVCPLHLRPQCSCLHHLLVSALPHGTLIDSINSTQSLNE